MSKLNVPVEVGRRLVQCYDGPSGCAAHGSGDRYAVTQKKKPASIEDLKAWIKKLSPSELGDLGIEDPDIAFVSPRDNQSFVLVKSGGSGPGDVLAYEKIGEGGKHYIVTPMGAAFEMEEAELKRRVPSAK